MTDSVMRVLHTETKTAPRDDPRLWCHHEGSCTGLSLCPSASSPCPPPRARSLPPTVTAGVGAIKLLNQQEISMGRGIYRRAAGFRPQLTQAQPGWSTPSQIQPGHPTSGCDRCGCPWGVTRRMDVYQIPSCRRSDSPSAHNKTTAADSWPYELSSSTLIVRVALIRAHRASDMT